MSSTLDLGSDRVGDVCDALDLSEHAQERAFELARAADFEHASINRSPDAVAAGAVYLAAILVNEPQTQAAVSGAAGVCGPTVRKTYHELAEAEGIALERRCRGRDRVSAEEIELRDHFFSPPEADRDA
jgi:transcription initiation factor TFIIIB Brf1 subunit/transcription initiation factor TFIIB